MCSKYICQRMSLGDTVCCPPPPKAVPWPGSFAPFFTLHRGRRPGDAASRKPHTPAFLTAREGVREAPLSQPLRDLLAVFTLPHNKGKPRAEGPFADFLTS